MFWSGFSNSGATEADFFALWGTTSEDENFYPEDDSSKNALAIVVGAITGGDVNDTFFWTNLNDTQELYYIIEYDGVRCSKCHDNCATCTANETDCGGDCNLGYEGADC